MKSAFGLSCQYSSQLPGKKNAIVSPNSKTFALINAVGIDIVDSTTCKTKRQVQIVDKIDSCLFSPDSTKLLYLVKDKSIVHILYLDDVTWKCRIMEGSMASMTAAYWSPDCNHVITENELGLQLMVWSLEHNQRYIITHPKTDALSASAFSEKKFGGLLAVVHRYDMQDYIAVYNPGSQWQEISKFKCHTNEVTGVQWMTGSGLILTVDSPLTYMIALYTPAGEILGSYSAYQHALGIRCISTISGYEGDAVDDDGYSLSRLVIAVGSYDGQVRLLSKYELVEVATLPLLLPHGSRKEQQSVQDHLGNSSMVLQNISLINNDPKEGVLLVEMTEQQAGTINNSFQADFESDKANTSCCSTNKENINLSQKNLMVITKASKPRALIAKAIKSNFDISTTFVPLLRSQVNMLPQLTCDPRDAKQCGKTGVSWCKWSNGGQYLAAREESMPRCLWIWNVADAMALRHIIVNMQPIVSACWRPLNEEYKRRDELLAYSLGTSRIYFWCERLNDSKPFYQETSGECDQSPMTIQRLEWSMDGSHLIISSQDSCRLCYVKLDHMSPK